MSRTIGHYAPWLLSILVGCLIVLTSVPAASSSAPWQVLVAVQVGVVFLAVSMFAHNRRLCGRCIAAVPLDAAGVAARYGRRFQVAHLFERKAYAIGYLTLLLGLSFVSDHPIGRYAWAVGQATLVYLLLSYVTHQRLQPWCPRCRNGGEEVTAPTTPSPVSSHV